VCDCAFVHVCVYVIVSVCVTACVSESVCESMCACFYVHVCVCCGCVHGEKSPNTSRKLHEHEEKTERTAVEYRITLMNTATPP